MDESDSPASSGAPGAGMRWSAITTISAGFAATLIAATVVDRTPASLLWQLAPVPILLFTLWWTAKGRPGHRDAVASAPRWHRWSAWLIVLLLIGTYIVLTSVRAAEGSVWVTFLTVACLVAASTAGLHAALSPPPSFPTTVMGLATVLGGVGLVLVGARLVRSGQTLVGGGLFLMALAFLALAIAGALAATSAKRTHQIRIAGRPWSAFAACGAIAVTGAHTLFGAEAYRIGRDWLGFGLFYTAGQCLLIGVAWAIRNELMTLFVVLGVARLFAPLGGWLVWFDVISHEDTSVALPGLVLAMWAAGSIYFFAYRRMRRGSSQIARPPTNDNIAIAPEGDDVHDAILFLIGGVVLIPVTMALFVVAMAPVADPLVTAALWVAILGVLIAVIRQARRSVMARQLASRALRFFRERPPPPKPGG